MRRRLTVILTLLCVGTLLNATGFAHGDAPQSPPPPVDDGALEPATRGTAAQLTPTLPPPPDTTVAPAVPPPPDVTAPPDPTAPQFTGVPFASGQGRRVVYSKSQQRVWIMAGDSDIARTYLVSGRLNQPGYGTYRVFSRSAYTCNKTVRTTCMRFMVRFTVGPDGDNIGFHEIPRKNGVPVQTDAQLGAPRSAGCIRQSTGDAEAMWAFASIGTVVVVVP